MATLILPPVLTSPRDDAVQLHRAFKGFGCDKEAVINVLAHRNSAQRSLIEQEYRLMYSEELSQRLVKELSGDFERAICLWLPDPALRDATIVRKCFTGDTVDLRVATEVICSRSSAQVQQFKQAYLARFHSYLEHDIELHSTGDLKQLLLAFVSHARYEGPEVDPAIAEHDAKSLYKAGEKRLGTDEKTFIRIFSERSPAHLAVVSSAYDRMYGHSLKKAIKRETSGNFEFALLTILQCTENPAKYFAKLLHKAMKGFGTNDSTLTRIIVTRTEIDMQYIKAAYQKKHGKSLNDAVHSETSGSYRAFLLSLLGPSSHHH
ncbi:hypothetical protein M569_08322 [Genlisea aurea]|uniref:Annexin n=1 Tax=Genlisea aurea TaxID=192259 RepID=S8DTH9_9LAMI|nr:hypothetical protein M569_08322 [Genlisea aurea]